MSDLRAVIVVDYQNVHLTGYGLFPSVRYGRPHEALVHPLHFGNQLVQARNRSQREGMDAATLTGVRVYRGLPASAHDADAYARNQAQKANWTLDRRVDVDLRPLKYSFRRDDEGRYASDARGNRIVTGKREKGVDVLCALALVRESLRPDVDLVILASHDTDLEPALDEAISLSSAKVETFCWYDPAQRARCRQLRPSSGRRLWNTRLGETEFLNSLDRTNYA